MFPVGELHRLDSFLQRNAEESPTGTFTFGILIVDWRERLNRELVLNCLNVYDTISAQNFDFYIPGYSDHSYGDCVNADFCIKDKPYYYSRTSFLKFKRYLERVFHITINHTPVLILASVKSDSDTISIGSLEQYVSKFYVYNFSKNRESIEASDRFFLDVFDAVNKYDELSRSSGLDSTYLVKGDLIDVLTQIAKKYGPDVIVLVISFVIDSC